MALRSSWKASLRLSLVCVPVKAYPAAVSGNGEIRFHQLHADCGCRIQYQKRCPQHGQVTSDDIVSGYEYVRDQYVVIEAAELENLHGPSEPAITISEFISPESLDPVYAGGGKSYYLLPDGPVATRPYAVLCQAMQQAGRHALARAVIRGREQLVLLRPLERLLALSVLAYDRQVVTPETFADQLPGGDVQDEELELAHTLIEAATAETFDYSGYRDTHHERLEQLIEAKLAGTEPVVTPQLGESPPAGNLIEALRESVARLAPKTPARRNTNGRARRKAARRCVTSAQRRKKKAS